MNLRIVSVSSKENAIVQYSQFKISNFQKWNNQKIEQTGTENRKALNRQF